MMYVEVGAWTLQHFVSVLKVKKKNEKEVENISKKRMVIFYFNLCLMIGDLLFIFNFIFFMI